MESVTTATLSPWNLSLSRPAADFFFFGCYYTAINLTSFAGDGHSPVINISADVLSWIN